MVILLVRLKGSRMFVHLLMQIECLRGIKIATINRVESILLHLVRRGLSALFILKLLPHRPRVPLLVLSFQWLIHVLILILEQLVNMNFFIILKHVIFFQIYFIEMTFFILSRSTQGETTVHGQVMKSFVVLGIHHDRFEVGTKLLHE